MGLLSNLIAQKARFALFCLAYFCQAVAWALSPQVTFIAENGHRIEISGDTLRLFENDAMVSQAKLRHVHKSFYTLTSLFDNHSDIKCEIKLSPDMPKSDKVKITFFATDTILPFYVDIRNHTLFPNEEDMGRFLITHNGQTMELPNVFRTICLFFGFSPTNTNRDDFYKNEVRIEPYTVENPHGTANIEVNLSTSECDMILRQPMSGGIQIKENEILWQNVRYIKSVRDNK